jgi:feruloyl esterase
MSCVKAAILLGLALATAPAVARGPAAPEKCAALTGGDAQAEWMVEKGAVPAHCRVQRILRPAAGSRVGVTVLLPAPSRWTGRLQMLGNGGYSSALPERAMEAALARGSTVVATDTGHEGDEPTFAQGRPQAIVDWGWRAVHVSVVAAKMTVVRYYGREASHSYFAGCSTGGHQAMSEAQRFPADFDGIVAGAPGSNRVRLNAAFLWQFISNHRRTAPFTPILDSRDLALLHQNALARCAATGTGAGRWLEDPFSCRPRPEALLCQPGMTVSCLTPEKVEAARAMYNGVRDPRNGSHVTFPWLPGSELGWDAYWADPRQPTQPARADFWRLWAARGQTWNWRHFAFPRDLTSAQRRLSRTIDATDPNLIAFRRRGGKLIQYHGLADPVVSPLDTLSYRSTMLRRTGYAASWYRLFLAPGMGHCVGGPGFARFDPQPAVEAWVERDKAPMSLIATDSTGAQRPLCDVPARSVFVAGDPRLAASYKCEAVAKTATLLGARAQIQHERVSGVRRLSERAE